MLVVVVLLWLMIGGLFIMISRLVVVGTEHGTSH